MRMVYAVMNCERHDLKGGKVQRKTVSTHCVKKKKKKKDATEELNALALV